METAIPCLVEGFVEGDVAVKGSVVVRVAAEVRGSVTCDAIEVYGKIGRHIICTGKAVIGAGGFVEGSITAAVTEIDPLAIVNHNTFEEPESAFDDQVIGAVVSPSRAVVNELTWF